MKRVKRFQDQVEMVNIMESEDMGTIKAKIDELKAKDPGAFPEEPMVVEVKEAGGGAAEVAVAGVNRSSLRSRSGSTLSRRGSSSSMLRWPSASEGK